MGLDALIVLAPLLVPLVLLPIGGLIGRWQEQRHLRALDRREAELSGLLATNLSAPFAGLRVQHATLVAGEVVVGTDYMKRFVASLRKLVGGEILSYRNVLARSRREARLRMLEAAREQGSDLVLNVRYATSLLVTGASEITCYGTAVRIVR